MNSRLLRILGGKTEHYPYALETKFPRILNNLMSLWDSDDIDDYFMELMVSRRSNRIGFPHDVAAEIMHLSLVHAGQGKNDGLKDIWDAPATSFSNFVPHPDTDWQAPQNKLLSELQKYNLPATPEGYFEAAESGNRAAVALFLESGNNTEVHDPRGWTPLMIAAFKGHHEIVELLINHHADVNAHDLGGNSALHWAAFGGHVECAKMLIQFHAKSNEYNKFGWTPLMQATARNHLELVKLLIDSGVDLDKASDDGYTALHKAAASGYREIVALLLEQGADKNLRAIDGETPYKLAVKNGEADIINMLEGKH